MPEKQVVEALQVADVSTHVETRLVEGDEEMTRALEMVSTSAGDPAGTRAGLAVAFALLAITKHTRYTQIKV